MPQKIAVESIIRRDGGTRVTLGKMAYHFKPMPDGAHVAVVDDPRHVSRFLSISEGYRVYDPDLVDEPAPAPFVTPLPPAAEDESPVETDTIADDETNPPEDEAEPLPSLDGMSRADLEATFLKEVGRKPNAKQKDETLVAQIVAVRMERANGGE
jgi:hypothetical protein